MILFRKGVSQAPTSTPTVAIDTETFLFDEPVVALNGKTRIKPFNFPKLVVGSFGYHDHVLVLDAADALAETRHLLLDPTIHLVFHNLVYDIRVLEKADPTLRPLFCAAVESARIHDTRILEVLLQIARGARTISQKYLVQYPTLKALAKKRCGIDLEKGGERITFGDYASDINALPAAHRAYAALDAEATRGVYLSQVLEASVYTSSAYCNAPVLPHCNALFGPLTENIQIKAALAFAWMEQFPLRVDLPRASELQKRLDAEADLFRAALVSFGWAARGPKTGKFAIHLAKIQAVLELYAKENNLVIPRTPLSNKISTRLDDWSPHIPKIGSEIYASPSAVPAENVVGRLQVWLRLLRVQKLLTTYVHTYAASEYHYPQYSIIGARTSRTSCAKPNVQNVPKRKDGIRALFVPEDGQVLVERDYRAAELVGLAQTYHLLYGSSVLGRTLNARVDPHLATARRITPDFDEMPESQRLSLRQAAKALNFGLPGGLGVLTLIRYAKAGFGVSLSEEEARRHRNAVLNADPELRDYLSERHNATARGRLVARNVGCSFDDLITSLNAWKNPWDHSKGILDRVLHHRLQGWKTGGYKPTPPIPLPPGFDPKFDLFKSHARSPAGFIRGNCSFTESHNLPFQSLVAAGAKLAMWNLYQSWLAEPCFTPVAFIHDSIVIQTPLDTFDKADAVLNTAMVLGLSRVCPDILVETEGTGALTRWGKDTNPWGAPTKEP